uniref:Uncharacterized protein n=1 Tax=Nelumbo nucifera TaxID=4432 RepID=A0A822YN26_NELNU|nr:TPA_asm: hypothetical protein HUJ06_011266 [Nelumbo nucifera]
MGKVILEKTQSKKKKKEKSF